MIENKKFTNCLATIIQSVGASFAESSHNRLCLQSYYLGGDWEDGVCVYSWEERR